MQNNQVLAIEPGVYVPYNSEWPKHYQGIGIRIEDNVVVGQDTYEVLSIDALKEIVDIEQSSIGVQ